MPVVIKFYDFYFYPNMAYGYAIFILRRMVSGVPKVGLVGSYIVSDMLKCLYKNVNLYGCNTFFS